MRIFPNATAQNRRFSMQIDNSILKTDERVAYTLRSLYSGYGYCQYKMSKFEEYALYVQNKDFLISDGIISFTDMSGRLLALKPDVTLSIINNSKDEAGRVQKLYYDENVYRIPKGARSFKEIRQIGLECIGDIGIYEVCEVLSLAIRSLSSISESYIFELSHVGLMEAVIDSLSLSERMKKKAMSCINQKNPDDLLAVCREGGVSDRAIEVLDVLMGNYTDMDGAISALDGICASDRARECFEELNGIVAFIKNIGLEKNVKIDFSLTGNKNYYSGVAFRGYIYGIPSSVLSGGQYDKLMNRMGRGSGAIGFAVYLDLLERLNMTEQEFDVDVLLLHNGDIAGAIRQADRLSAEGKTVRVSAAAPDGLRYRELARMAGEDK